MLVKQVSQALVLLLELSDDRLLVCHFVKECVGVGLKLAIHRVSGVKLVISLTQSARGILILLLQLIESLPKVVKVSRLGCELLAHRVLKMVERELQVLNVRLTALHPSLLLHKIPTQPVVDCRLRV